MMPLKDMWHNTVLILDTVLLLSFFRDGILYTPVEFEHAVYIHHHHTRTATYLTVEIPVS